MDKTGSDLYEKKDRNKCHRRGSGSEEDQDWRDQSDENVVSEVKKLFETRGINGVEKKMIGALRACWFDSKDDKSWFFEKNEACASN